MKWVKIILIMIGIVFFIIAIFILHRVINSTVETFLFFNIRLSKAEFFDMGLTLLFLTFGIQLLVSLWSLSDKIQIQNTIILKKSKLEVYN